MKRTALTASSLLLAITTLTACGGDAKEPDNATAERPKPTTSKEQQVTPDQKLATLMVRPADVDGFSVKEPDAQYAFAKSPKDVEVDKPACAPLAYAMNQLPLGTAQAELTRVVSKGPTDPSTYITLTTYETTGGAQSALTDVGKAVAACGDGFTAKARGGSSSAYDSVTEEKAGPTGDETLGFKATTTFRGASHTLHTQVVRKGDVLGVYFSVDGLAIANARPSDAKLPTAVVKAQNAKLG